jgi:hypothetical protein
MTAMALFLTLLDRFKNHLFHERKRMKKLALFLTDVKKFNFFTFGVTISILCHRKQFHKDKFYSIVSSDY